MNAGNFSNNVLALHCIHNSHTHFHWATACRSVEHFAVASCTMQIYRIVFHNFNCNIQNIVKYVWFEWMVAVATIATIATVVRLHSCRKWMRIYFAKRKNGTNNEHNGKSNDGKSCRICANYKYFYSKNFLLTPDQGINHRIKNRIFIVLNSNFHSLLILNEPSM